MKRRRKRRNEKKLENKILDEHENVFAAPSFPCFSLEHHWHSEVGVEEEEEGLNDVDTWWDQREIVFEFLLCSLVHFRPDKWKLKASRVELKTFHIFFWVRVRSYLSFLCDSFSSSAAAMFDTDRNAEYTSRRRFTALDSQLFEWICDEYCYRLGDKKKAKKNGGYVRSLTRKSVLCFSGYPKSNCRELDGKWKWKCKLTLWNVIVSQKR